MARDDAKAPAPSAPMGPVRQQCSFASEQPQCRMPAGAWPDFGPRGYCAWHIRMRHYPTKEHGFEEFDRFVDHLTERRVCDVWTHFAADELFDVVRGRDTGRLRALDRPCVRGWGCDVTGEGPYPQAAPAATALPMWAREGASGISADDLTVSERLERAADQGERYRKWRQDHPEHER